MTDIVTVVFEPELPVLQVQAQSIDLFCRNLGMKNIWVVINDCDHVADQIDRAWWGSLAPLVKIIPRNYFGDDWVENGWVSQQALKLLASTLSENSWTMILDAKTIMTDHAFKDTFLVNDHTLTLGIAPIIPIFQTSANIASKLLNIKVDEVAEPTGVPFIFETALVRELISFVEKTTGQTFAKWFQSQGMLTEFILYTAFVKYKHQDLTKIYKSINKQKLGNNICHSQWQHFDRLLCAAKQQRPLTIGVHRNAWNQLTFEQKWCYVDFLCQLGITKAERLL